MKLKLAETEEEIKFLYDTRILPEIDKYLVGNPPKTYEQHKKYIEEVQGVHKRLLVCFDQEKGGIRVGYSQLYDWEEHTVEVGFVVRPEFQGEGYGNNLVKATVEYCLKEFPDKRIILYVKKDNKRAIHVYEKVGFIQALLPLNTDTLVGMQYCEDLG